MAAGQAVRKEGKSPTEPTGHLCAQTRVKSLRKRQARRNETHDSSETGASEICGALTGSGNEGVTVNSLYCMSCCPVEYGIRQHGGARSSCVRERPLVAAEDHDNSGAPYGPKT